MTSVVIDPVFSKAFRLLFSDDPDSADQMRAMLDEALRQKYGTHKTLTSVLPKKLMAEESSTSEHQPPSPSLEKTEDLESEDSNHSPDNELNELNILEDDLLCVVCRQMMQGDGNRLVECQECHGLYHQECHQPPINETEIPVNDPRLAWYCATCKKKLNKAISSMKNHKPVVSLPTSTPASPKLVVSGGKPPFASNKTYTSCVSKSGNASSSKSSSKTSPPGSSSGSGTSTSKSSKPAGSSKGPVDLQGSVLDPCLGECVISYLLVILLTHIIPSMGYFFQDLIKVSWLI